MRTGRCGGMVEINHLGRIHALVAETGTGSGRLRECLYG